MCCRQYFRSSSAVGPQPELVVWPTDRRRRPNTVRRWPIAWVGGRRGRRSCSHRGLGGQRSALQPCAPLNHRHRMFALRLLRRRRSAGHKTWHKLDTRPPSYRPRLPRPLTGSRPRDRLHFGESAASLLGHTLQSTTPPASGTTSARRPRTPTTGR